MKKKRKESEAFILEYIGKLLPGDTSNVQIYKDLFAEMDDETFDDFMGKLGRKEIRLAVIAPNFAKAKVTVANNLNLADELGHNFFERLWIDPGNDIPPYLSPVRYLVGDMILRRQAQLQVKKMSVPEDNRSVDDLTGQPSGKSEASRISYPETQVLAALKLDKNIVEMTAIRGGDTKGFNALNDSFARTGGASQKAIEHLRGGVKSTQTLNSMLISMHLQPAGLVS
ncbi:hypothetical protein [Paraburkholderia sp. BCC1886]|uniref:hypothetical protein n=1 Tax=Paraburkholderia sp. BCC1886 TaxID=2562670 RepID=UPI001182DF6D|nr:hypothetical protein [Paraburkholderia sp. BCC1886]